MVRRRSLIVLLVLPFLLGIAARPGLAAGAQTVALVEALRVGEIVEIMAEEGREHARDLRMDLFPGGGGPAWAEAVDTLYDPARMLGVFSDALEASLDAPDLRAATVFYGSELGQRVVDMELAARRAMQDSAVESAAIEAWAHIDPGSRRAVLIETLVATGQLIEMNVAGTLNATYAFYSGFAAGGGMGEGEEELLAQVWSREDEVRADTMEWVYSYLTLACQPLSDAELADYADFAQSRPGRTLNYALFGAFDEMYNAISHGLGLAAARAMTGEEL